MKKGVLEPRVMRPAPRVLRQVHALAPRKVGKIAAIEPESGKYYLADTLLEAADKARERHPGKGFYIVRVGYRSAHWHRGGIRLRKQ